HVLAVSLHGSLLRHAMVADDVQKWRRVCRMASRRAVPDSAMNTPAPDKEYAKHVVGACVDNRSTLRFGAVAPTIDERGRPNLPSSPPELRSADRCAKAPVNKH